MKWSQYFWSKVTKLAKSIPYLPYRLSGLLGGRGLRGAGIDGQEG